MKDESAPQGLDLDKQLERLIAWANERQITEQYLPRDKKILKNLKTLYLDCLKLVDLPPEIGALTSLVSLDLGSNILPFIRPDIKNQISHIPKEIGHLRHLKALYLNYNELESLPEEIKNLTRLNILGLFYNQLESLPKGISQLKKLTELYLGGNRFCTLPDEITQLEHLRLLGLGENQLSSLPDNFVNLQNLRILNLNDNQFETLPEQLTWLNLKELSIKFNPIKTLPQTLQQLSTLERLNCDEALEPQAREIFKDNKKVKINPDPKDEILKYFNSLTF